jgi:Ran GTPase-activating protein (RanGAP) involved in mRNA processing and transport
MTTKEEFNAACEALGKNDPWHSTDLDLGAYGSLLDRERVQQVVRALEKNTIVEALTLSENFCLHSILQLSHFLKTSPSLQQLEMRGKVEEREKASTKASIVFESISRSAVLVDLSLRDVVLGDNCPFFEEFLSSTRTLQVLQFTYFQNNSTMTHLAAQAIGSGLAQNKSLVKLHWNAHRPVDFMEEVLVGLYDHISLKTLGLVTQLTKSSSLALRSLLHCNRTLERLDLKQLDDNEEVPMMVAVLAGLAKNTGLKRFKFESDLVEFNAPLAKAWTKMLQRNTSITILDLRKNSVRNNTGVYAECELCSAVAKGLAANSTLETLYLPDWSSSNPEVFHGLVWQEALASNHCLKMLSFSDCSISLEGFKCLARGLLMNTSLESLDLTSTGMRDDSVVALVHGLRTNETLKCLDLTGNCFTSPSGRAAIERLLGYNVLRELILEETQESIGVSILASGLSTNSSLEKLNLEGSFVDDQGTETFRSLCECLRGNTTLRYLNVQGNAVDLDAVCLGELRLGTMSLETLDLSGNCFGSGGIAALAKGLQGPCTLKELILMYCQLDDTGLLILGEALTTNNTLEVLDVSRNAFTDNGASQFFDMLPQMKGLKAVYGLVNMIDDMRNGIAPTLSGLALVTGLRENTKLHKIFADDDGTTVDSCFSPGVAREINFYLGLNRCGRMLLKQPGGLEPPSGLWPLVLAKMAGPRDTSLLFYFLQNKPKIVKWNATASRKRKASDTPSVE